MCGTPTRTSARTTAPLTMPPVTPVTSEALVPGSVSHVAFQARRMSHGILTGRVLLTQLTGCGAVQSTAAIDAAQTSTRVETTEMWLCAINSGDGQQAKQLFADDPGQTGSTWPGPRDALTHYRRCDSHRWRNLFPNVISSQPRIKNIVIMAKQ